MNHIPVETIASSVPFRFLVGPNQREFTIHSALFSHQSPVFEKLINGNFSEATEKCVTWKSVDEDTFIRFWQYTYTGKYTADRPIIELGSESEAAHKAEQQAALEAEWATQEGTGADAIAEEEEGGGGEGEEMAQPLNGEIYSFEGLSSRWEQRLDELQPNVADRAAREAEKQAVIAKEEKEMAYLLNKSISRGKLFKKDSDRLAHLREKADQRTALEAGQTPPNEQTKRDIRWDLFKRRRASTSFGAYRPTGPLDVGFFRSNHAHEDYTNTFLSHARLYVFAECYGITELMELSMDELHTTLVTFTLHDERVNDIVALVSYCYENLVPETLRDMVSLYAACKIDKLWLSEQFQALVEDHGELSKYLIGLMVKER